MEKKKLLELAKQLNGLADEDGTALAVKKVKVVAVSDEGLKVSFLEACESVEEAKEELIPNHIAEAYNELIKEDPREKGKKEPEPEKRKEEKISGKKKVEKVKEAKPEKKKTEVKKEKTEKKTSDRTTQKYSHFIFAKKQILAGKKDEDIKQKLIDRYIEEGRKEDAAKLRAGEVLKIMKIALTEE